MPPARPDEDEEPVPTGYCTRHMAEVRLGRDGRLPGVSPLRIATFEGNGYWFKQMYPRLA
jgi:hypothetical protein